MIAPVEATPEARLVELLERGRSIEIIKQQVGWSTFEVRECAAHHGYEFDKEGCPHLVARAASARRTAPNPAYPVAQPHEAVTGPAFVPSPAPARRVHDDDCGFVGDRHDGPCLPPPHVVVTDTVPGGRPVAGIVGHTPVVTVDEDAVTASVWLDWLRRAQASEDKAVAAALRRVVTRLERLAETLDAEVAARQAALERAAAQKAALDKLQKAEAALARARRAAEETGALSAKRPHRSGATKQQSIDRAAVREWARASGWPTLPQVGRIPADVQAAYDLAHPAPATP